MHADSRLTGPQSTVVHSRVEEEDYHAYPPPVSLVARTWNVARVALMCSVALIAVLASSPVAQAQSLAGCSNPNVTGGGSCAAGPVVLSAQDQAILAAKTRLANDLEGVRLGKVSATQFHSDLVAYAMSLPEPYRSVALSRANAPLPSCRPRGACPPLQPASQYTNMTQQRQQQWYYCGPATASEILASLGSSYSQSYLAGSSWLKTDEYGQTSWNPAVMAPTLTSLNPRNLYYATQSASGTTLTQWQNDLITDIWTYQQPIAGNTVESWGGPYLVGHSYAPQNDFKLYHWVAIYGYSEYGSYTAYADSISGNSGNWGWTWASHVPPYSTISSSTMYSVLGTMGWVW